VASFNGTDLGAGVVMRTAGMPTALQTFAYPGISGVGLTYNGSRGGRTSVYGVLYGSDLPGLFAWEDEFRQYQLNSAQGTLIDTVGFSWSDAVIMEYEPMDTIDPAPGVGYARAYRMEFFHPG
jgi:hypothetical protein